MYLKINVWNKKVQWKSHLLGAQTASDSPLLKSFTNTHCTKLVLITMFTQAMVYALYLAWPSPQSPALNNPDPSLFPVSEFCGFVSQSGQDFFKTNPMGMKIIFFNYDLISRTATKQINCHAHRAKNIQVPFCLPVLGIDSTCVMKLHLPEIVWLPPYKFRWQILNIAALGGLKQHWCFVYISRYVNRFYTINLFPKNKLMKSIQDIAMNVSIVHIPEELFPFSHLCCPYSISYNALSVSCRDTHAWIG